MSSPQADLSGRFGALAALLLAVDPHGLGGAVLDHPLHEQARQFGALVRAWLPAGAPLRRVPAGVTADRLYGGVDLASTLSAGRLVAERGVLAAADGGVLVLPMAERLAVAARTALCEVLDHGEITVQRDGIADRHASRVCALLLDESVDEELVHPALGDRVAFRVRFDGRTSEELEGMADESAAHHFARLVREARARLPQVTVDDAWAAALCQTADAFGVDSVRATLFALRCARAHAALDGRLAVTEADAEKAAALVLAPRATRLPPPPPPPEEEEEEQGDDPAPPEQEETPQQPPEPPPQLEQPPEPPESEQKDNDDDSTQPTPDSGELLRDAVQAALPPNLLAQLVQNSTAGSMQGRVGEETPNLLRGRPRGARSGLPRGGARLHLLETLRAAAPWQRVRERSAGPASATAAPRPRVAVRREDFRIRRFVERTGTTVIFVVDASGSSALYRLAEAKGAVELLLAESYARRDRVSLVAFRGQGTEVLLPPTRALARAKKVLAALPGGGGTPMAHAIDAALEQAIATRRGGSAPLVVMMTDGRANIARDGTPGRKQAEVDALAAAARFASQHIPAMFVDTSPRGELVARKLAEAMKARYILLPSADARALGGLVRTAMQMAEGGA
ncbi:magnesium chelatase subunit D [Gemmatimonas sp.]|uniref:magnesium chelatase subunit D n=1 Tax=Gemmatimonas sp. TaxID=1962908 RepID=UPI0022C68FF9|nr:magnesium chelatase subunit D [Gemmatimonas sp.]MCZ8204840.1 magnesium chelatase subunit D [Gemmatimonas sp.]